jgi:hypothetical protein
MPDYNAMTPAELGQAYRDLEEDNRHHETALLVATVAGDADAFKRLTEIKGAWEHGRNWCSRERYDISQPLWRELVKSRRLLY